MAPDAHSVRSLEEALGLPRVICAILANRGLGDPDQAKAFLRPLLSTLHPPEDLPGLTEAVGRIREAIQKGETIFVHGDYDVDGMAGTALLTQWLRRLGARVEPFIPNRLTDGYDLGQRGLQEARRAGASLLITVDCGTLAHDAISHAEASGLQVIVTDHHSPGPELPPALAVLNPNRLDSTYPNKGLCGAGVAFKLCQGLGEAHGIRGEELHPFLDLVALATIADLVPLTGENRTLVRFGLRALARTPNPGVRALVEVAGLDDGVVTAGKVGFVLAPRLNAVGRLGDPNLALRLLLTEDPGEARRIAREAEAMNGARRAEDRRTLDEALAQLSGSFEPGEDYGVVLSSESWHPGVVGIVASRVVERIHRPVVLVAFNGTRGKGSARSIPGFHLLDAIRGAGEHLDRFGGHRQAAGMELRRENLSAFRDAFNREARRALEGRDLRPILGVDLEVGLEEMTPEMFGYLQYIGPHGIGNPRPVFLARKVEVAEPPRVVGANHLKLRLRQGEVEMDAIGFGLADRIDPRTWGPGPINVVFQLQENEFRGVRSLQANLKDLVPAEVESP
ncbi:MAG: single-stranded-DNA-specific exonuclease RecJ [Longimicrobiales bacterium]